MSSMNKAIIVGNLGADPEIRSFQNGGRVANFSIATSETWTDKQSGEKQERTQWHRCVCFVDGLVGIIQQYVQKGSKVLIEGQIETRKWQDKSGADRYSTEIVMRPFNSKLLMLSNNQDGSGGNQNNEGNYDQGNQNVYSDGQSNSGGSNQANYELDDEIPF